MSSVVSVPASSIQAGPSCSTSRSCFSCASSAGAQKPVGHHGDESAEFVISNCTYYYLYSVFYL